MSSYIHFTEEQKQRAAAVNLEEFLRCRGEKLLSSGREKRLASDHSVTVRGNEWYDHAEERGGHAVSFVQRFYGLSYPDAVTMLLGGELGTAYPSAGERTEEPAKPFALPPANKDMRRVFAYLIKHRGIARDVVAHFAKAGLLYEDMFNRKSIYALNKKDPNAIVYTDADGNLIRLTRDDFSNEEEFLRWKKISDMDYHGEEKVDHLYYDGTLPLESLAEEVIAVPSAEEGYITEIDLSERHLLENLLLEGMGTKLTERQRTRLWLYCINGVTAAEIASFEGIAQQNVSKSIASAKKKLKKFLKNRV